MGLARSRTRSACFLRPSIETGQRQRRRSGYWPDAGLFLLLQWLTVSNQSERREYRGVWPGSGPGRPLRTVWLRWLLSLRRLLSLLWRRGRLLCGSATRLDSLRLANTPRFGLRV